MRTEPSLLCIGAGDEQVAGIELGRRMGYRVVAVDGNPQAPGLARADSGLVADLRDEQALIRIARDINARCVLPVPLGSVLTSVGAVNDALGLRGISRRAALACTDKMLMRERLAAAGVAQPGFRKVTAHDQVWAAAANFGLPMILKPARGSGSRGVVLVRSADELAAALAQADADGRFSAPGGLLVETELTGEEFGVDAVVESGRVRVLSLRSKVISPPPYRIAHSYTGPMQLASEVAVGIEQTLQTAAMALGLDDCLLHADLMVTVKGTASVIELSGRPSGFGLSYDLLPACLGFHPVEQTICMMLGRDFSFEPRWQRVGTLQGLFDRPGVLAGWGDLAAARALPGVLSIRLPLAIGDQIPPLCDGANWWRAGQLMLVADHLDDLDALRLRVMKLLDLQVK